MKEYKILKIKSLLQQAEDKQTPELSINYS